MSAKLFWKQFGVLFILSLPRLFHGLVVDRQFEEFNLNITYEGVDTVLPVGHLVTTRLIVELLGGFPR
ncbi:hypothetical protein [Geobacillus stearothermophilus]|uniref:hypothetical protein n=1 Tax=Geobacillus stearothermophilus TaxID=1422 RepID=UPI002EA42785|nr:hypothetical protein [Geobacillus stearothermophilus]